jgi:hypothetical protein
VKSVNHHCFQINVNSIFVFVGLGDKWGHVTIKLVIVVFFLSAQSTLGRKANAFMFSTFTVDTKSESFACLGFMIIETGFGIKVTVAVGTSHTFFKITFSRPRHARITFAPTHVRVCE